MLAISRLASVEKLRARALDAIARDDPKAARAVVAELTDFVSHKPETAAGRRALASLENDIIDGANLVRIAETEILAPLDARAKQLILDAAKRVSLVTAVSPRALVDIVYVLFESGRLIRRLSELYGGRPGTLGFFRLARGVLAHLAVTGAIAAGDDFVHQIVGQGLAARLSAKLGEGVVNGMMTARIGVAAMDVTRPLPFSALKRPGMTDFLAALASFTRKKAGSGRRLILVTADSLSAAAIDVPLTISGHGSDRSFHSTSCCRVSLDEACNPVQNPAACSVGRHGGGHGRAGRGGRARRAVLPVDRRRLGRPGRDRRRQIQGHEVQLHLRGNDAGQEARHVARRRLPRRRVHAEDVGERRAEQPAGYKGKFMDGAEGSGLDIISGNVVNGRKVVFAINRNQLRGVMQARLPDDNTMNVTVSVRVDESMVPVIGMSLKRVDDTAGRRHRPAVDALARRCQSVARRPHFAGNAAA